MVTVKELQALLRARGLPVSGRKAVLVERLAIAGVPVPAPGAAPPSSAKAVISSSSGSSKSSAIAIPCDPTPLAAATSAACLRIASWNVAGLRGLLRRESGVASLRHLADEVDILLLQETKLQTKHVYDVEAELLEVLNRGGGGPSSSSAAAPPWRAAWASSTTTRLGYAGVCTAWTGRRSLGAEVAAAASCAPLPIDPEHDADREGRTLLLDLPLSGGRLGVVNVYTPNAGAELRRLAYRTSEDGWDGRFRAAMLRAQQPSSNGDGDGAGGGDGRGGSTRHLCVGGDFNVAVEDADFFNPHEKRMAKQAGTTAEERASMRRYSEPPLCMADAFRHMHPGARGQYSYWSQRARNRPRNRGLRLDYFLLSESVLAAGALRDCQILQALEGSDHCPVVVELELGRLLG